MASGCAVISNSGPNVEWLLTDDVAQLASPTPEALAEAVSVMLGNEPLRAQKAAAGLAFAQRTDWISEVKAVESAFYRGLGIASPDKQHG